MRWLLTTILVPRCLLAADWYVDNAATGSANGSSWVNAWIQPADVVWGGGGVAAGDTLYISGGTVAKTYTNGLTVRAHGTAANRISIRPGQEAGHNGVVILDGSSWGDFCKTNAITCHRNYITVDGRIGSDPTPHLRVLNWFNSTNSSGNHGYGIYASPGHFMRVYSCVFSNINTPMYIHGATNVTVGWCDLTALGDACIACNDMRAFPEGSWDTSLFFSNRINCVYTDPTGGPDGIQGGRGSSVFYNRFESINDPTKTNRFSNHVDYWQSDDNQFVKLYSNECVNTGDSCFSPAAWTPGRGLNNLRIYNNVFRLTQSMDPFPNFIRMYNTLGLGGYTNVYIVNNAFIDMTNSSSLGVYAGADVGTNPGTGNIFANNIFVNIGKPGAFALNWKWGEEPGDIASAWTLTNNIIYNANPDNSLVRMHGTTYTVAQWKASFDPSTGTNLPAFTAYTPYATNNDFHLLRSDTVARDMGLDFSAIFTTDYDGNPRGTVWDIGPYEAARQKLKVHGRGTLGGSGSFP